MLQILDQEGKLVEEWTSEKEHHVISGLPEGEYVFHEKQAPYEKGYVSASDIDFKISEEYTCGRGRDEGMNILRLISPVKTRPRVKNFQASLYRSQEKMEMCCMNGSRMESRTVPRDFRSMRN